MPEQEQEPRNFFDELNPLDPQAAANYATNQKAAGERIAYLTHKVFAETEAGRELLELYKEIVLMTAVVEPGLPREEHGCREGYNRWVRGIIRSIKQVEAGEK